MKLFLILVLLSIFSCSAQESISKEASGYPVLPYEKETIRLNEKTYTEHFRNIESLPDSVKSNWVDAQNVRTRENLWSLQEKAKWTSILEDIGNRYVSEPYMFRYGEDGSAFYIKYAIDSDVTSLYSYNKNETEKLLISTDSLSRENG
ncbi:MAG: hypothetical protein WBG48_13180, partial [Pricia sp.]